MRIEFTIPGVAHGKGRPRFAKRGNFVSTYTDEKTAKYENLVKIAAAEAMQGRAPMDCAVGVVIFLYVTPPESWSAKKKNAAIAREVFPTTKPDVDNVVKGIFDACNDVVFKDDKQVVDLSVKKRYSDISRAKVVVTSEVGQ